MTSYFLLRPTSSIPRELMKSALSDLHLRDDASGDNTKLAPFKQEKLNWSPSCQAILEVYVREHFRKINIDAPEFKIVDRSKVKNTGGKVFELRGGKTYELPRDIASAFVAINLATVGSLTTDVKIPNGETTRITWEEGSLLYLTRDCELVCLGDGTTVCIMLILRYGDEQEQASMSRALEPRE